MMAEWIADISPLTAAVVTQNVAVEDVVARYIVSTKETVLDTCQDPARRRPVATRDMVLPSLDAKATKRRIEG